MTLVPKPFYFVRHGETDWNLKKITMGQTDIELNKTGLLQAERVASNLTSIEFGSIVTSPLKRAFQTAQIIAQPRSLPLILSDAFKEAFFGEIQGKEDQWLKIEKWAEGSPIKEAESFLSFTGRVKEGLCQVFSLSAPVLIVAHGGTYWTIQKALNLPLTVLDNCAAVYHRPPEHPTDPWFISSLGSEE